MTEALNTQKSELLLPPEADLPGLSVKDLHSLWRQNQGPLVQIASSFDLNSIPALAMHGSASDRIQSIAQGDDPMMWVFVAYERAQDTSEFLRNLYCLASGSATYSFYLNEGWGNIKGEAGVVLFGVDNGRFMTPDGKPHDSWSSVINKHTFFPQIMPRSIRPPRPGETADYHGYMAEPLDSAEELSFFDFRTHPAKIIAYDRFVPREQDKRIPIFDAQTPKYLLRSVDQDPVIDSYRREMLRRLFSQNLVATILAQLKTGGLAQTCDSQPSEKAQAIDELRDSIKTLKP